MSDYSLMDATLEILLMLLAAFLLGWLFCWLMKKLFGRKPKTIKPQKHVDLNEPTFDRSEPSGIVSSNRDRLYNTDADMDLDVDVPEINRPNVDLNEVDLPKTPTVDIDEPQLSQARPRIDLPDLNAPDLDVKGKLDAGIGAGKSTLGKGLGAATAGIGAVAVGASAFKDKAVDKVSDINLPDFESEIDLPEVEQSSLDAEIDLPEIPEIQAPTIDSEGVDLSTGSISGNLPDVDLPDLKPSATDALDTGKSKLGAGIGAATAGIGAVAAGASSLKDSAAEKVNGVSDKLTRPELPIDSASSESNIHHDSRLDTSQTGADDLTRISGVDQQVVGVLNSQGIHTYQDLQEANRTDLKSYLDATGDSRLSELEPASWPHQATLCANRNWNKLSEYQSFLTGSNLDTRQATPSYAIEDGDDLKKVEGIGPFFESLLNEAGIKTYEQLKNSDRDTLKEIIDAAGPDYRMHEPETWPYQAGLAHRGEWKKLQDYIHFMTGRG